MHHNEDEISRVLKGRFRLRIGEETVEPGPGGTLVMPLCYGSGVVQPGGFEQFFLNVITERLQVPPTSARIPRSRPAKARVPSGPTRS